MSLFIKVPQTSDPVNYVTVGIHKIILIVGLGNPGPEYEGTRHNIGFAAIDSFVAANSDMEPWMAKKDLKALISTGRLADTKVLAVKPTTFMNLSGEALQAVASFYKIQTDKIIVVHDEIDVDFGQIRLRMGGSSAGHNGIRSVSEHLSDEGYGRVRIGVGPKTPEQMDSADFVLQKFSSDEQSKMPQLLRETNAILSELAFGNELQAETRNFLL
jgi:peptidyl-tRNA hydrolase, PTH1 family